MIKAAILTISDSCSVGKREDISGHTIEEILTRHRFQIRKKRVVPDSREAIVKELKFFSDKTDVDVVFTTGGTGLGPRDVTPEATKTVCKRMVPGLAEMMRFESLKKTPNAMLSRSVAGIRHKTLIINLPGSPKAVKECLEIVLPVLPHAVAMMHGGGHK